MTAISYYTEPLCYELQEKKVDWCLSDGVRCHAEFGMDTLVWSAEGETPQTIGYTCQKLDDGIYFVMCLKTCLVLDFPADIMAVINPGAPEFTVYTGQFHQMLSPNCCFHHDLDGHTISWLVAPGKRISHLFAQNGQDIVIKLREDRYLLGFSPDPASRIFLAADLHCIRGVGIAGISQANRQVQCLPLAAYGTFVKEAGDDNLDYRYHLLGKELYNPVSAHPMPGGLCQYVAPTTRELCGTTLQIHLDDYVSLTVRFLTESMLEWAIQGQPMQPSAYQCTKGSDTVYLIMIAAEQLKGRCISLVWDYISHAVTAVIAEVGTVPEKPRLVKTHVYTGYSGNHGTFIPRHTLTSGLTGRRVIWTYNPNDEIMHIYMGDHLFRLGRWEGVLPPNPTEQALNSVAWINERKELYPCYEESASYLKISDHLYLYFVTEENLNLCLPKQGGNTLMVLLDETRVRYTGRCFGLNSRGEMEDARIGGIGRFSDIPDAVEALPVPFYPLHSGTGLEAEDKAQLPSK